MSDDLVKRLRVRNVYFAPDLSTPRAEPIKIEAADRIEELEERLENEMQDLDAADRRAKRLQNRIEELEAENRLLQDAVYIDDLTVTMQANDRSMAMAAMRRALDFLNADMPAEAKTALRTTIAELTGQNDDH